MDKPEDHGGGNPQNQFCKYCTDEQGNLMPREQVRAKMIQFYIQKQGKTQEEAEKLTDQLMGTMPAWKGEGVTAAAPTEPTTPPAPKPEPAKSEPPAPSSAPGPTATKPAPIPKPTPEPSVSKPQPEAGRSLDETPTKETPPAQPTEPTTEEPTE